MSAEETRAADLIKLRTYISISSREEEFMSEMEKKYKCRGREMDSMYVYFQYVTVYWLEREGKSYFFSPSHHDISPAHDAWYGMGN